MRKSALRKDFYMEIRRSRNRFLSIFFIVAMGVAFFSGIQASAPDMRYTGDSYFDQQELMNLKVVGSMGLTKNDIQALESIEGVEKVEPGYMTDVLTASLEDSQKVLRVESMPSSINKVKLSEGKMPTSFDECLLDAEFAANYGYQVGDVLRIHEDAADKEDRVLKTESFYITGIGTSPCYISFDRGSTTLGTGEVAGFLYVSDQAFSMDVYTQVYMLAEGVRETTAFTQEYDELVDLVMERVKDIQDIQCETRFAQVKEEAEEKLGDAKKELADGKAKAEDKLLDAKEEIEDGEDKLVKGKKELAQGKEELANGRKELEEKQKELEDAKKEVADGWVQINSAKEQLSKKEVEFDSKSEEAKKTIEEGEKALKEGKEQLEQGEKEYQKGLKEYQKGKSAYEEKQSVYDKNKKDYDSGVKHYEQGEKEYASGLQEYLEKKEQYDQAIAAGVPEQTPQMQEIKIALDQAKQELDSNRSLLDATKIQLDAARVQLEEGSPQLEAAKKELSKNDKKLIAAKKELDSSKALLQEKEKELEKGKKELSDGKIAIESGKKEIQNQEAVLISAQQKVDSGERGITDGWKKIEESQKEIQDAEEEIEENQQKLIDARKDYEEGKTEAEEEIADGEKKIADAQEEINQLKKPKWYITDRTSLPEYSGYGDNAERMKSIGDVFPVLFFLVAALISLTTMTRMVEEERTQIGTMKALGYGKVSIASKYVNYALLATVGGSILGVLVGEKIFPFVIIRAYGIMYHSMTDIKLPYNMTYAFMATGAAVFCTMTATISACYRELTDTPANLMRPPTPKQGKRVFMERIPILWNRMNFSWKSTVRNLFRYKKRFFMTVFGIGGCMALLLVAFGLQDSIMNIAVLQYEEIQTYDSLVIIEDEADENEIRELQTALEGDDGVIRLTDIYMKKLDLHFDKRNLSVFLMVPQEPEEFLDYVDFRSRISGQKYTLTEEGVIVTEKTAQLLNLSVGDVMNLAEADEEPVEVKVAAICENYLNHYVYMTPDLYRTLYGENAEHNTFLVKMMDSADEEALEQMGELALSHEAALSVSYTASLLEQVNDMLKTLDTVIWVLIVSAGMLAFVVLYNLNNININERKRELATLKVLGFYDMEMAAYVYRENILLTIFGAIFGVVMGIILHRFVIITVEVDPCMFGRNIDFSSFVYSILFTFGFSAFVNVVMFFKLRKIDMVESLKSVE